jgi:bifunctional non-homologous end joining protein LigD
MTRSSKAEASPSFVVPMAAVAVTELPEGPEWFYEAKLDGYRALLLKEGETVQIRSRNDKDMSRLYPRVTAAARALNIAQVILDGEIVATGPDGHISFQALQHRTEYPDHQIIFYVFDVLHVSGRNVMGEPLVKRRAKIATILGTNPTIRFSQELPGSLAAVSKVVQAAGLEGVVAKRRNSIYQPGERSSDWQKLKFDRQQEFVIGGYRSDGAKGVDALLVGFYDAGELVFAGKVRAGMVPHVRRELLRRLKPLEIGVCPFSNLPDSETGRWGGGVTVEQMAEMRWTRPELVAQIRFADWPPDGRLRLAKYLGIRDDKAAHEVVRE